ncbi:MAG: hypothetical protein ABI861_06305, partial [Panacibacter sp.]
MKRTSFLVSTCMLIQCAVGLPSLAQQNEDAVLQAKSERWVVKQNKGLFGLSKPDFGPYHTLEVVKLDSAVIKKKTKDST